MRFDRVNIETGEILKHILCDDEEFNKAFNDTFIYDEELRKFETEFEEKLREERINKILNEEEEIDKNGE